MIKLLSLLIDAVITVRNNNNAETNDNIIQKCEMSYQHLTQQG